MENKAGYVADCFGLQSSGFLDGFSLRKNIIFRLF